MALSLAACGTSAHGSDSNPDSAPTEKAPAVSLIDTVPGPQDVQVADLPGGRVLSSTGSTATWVTIPQAAAFNQAITSNILGELRGHAEAVGAIYVPEVFGVDAGLEDRGCEAGSANLPAEQLLADPLLNQHATGANLLNISCEPSLASGRNFGLQLRFVEGTPDAVTGDRTQTWYTNLDTGEVAAGSALLSEDGRTKLFSDASELGAKQLNMKVRDLPEANESLLASLSSATSDIVFTDDGAAVITLDDSFQQQLADQVLAAEATEAEHEEDQPAAEESPYTPGPLAIKIPSERAGEYLTPQGQAITASLVNDEPWAGNSAVPAGHTFVNCDLNPCLALTFDDGPSDLTPQLLADLSAEDAAATFFVIGQYVANLPEIVQQTVAAGHEVGNHTWAHPDLTTLGPEGAAWQVTETTNIVAESTGIPTPFVRPPYGAWNESVLETSQLPFIMWSVDTNDWQKPSTEELVNLVVNTTVPGDIVLMHDIHESTVQAVPHMLGPLKSRGFSLVTISQLFGGTPTELDIFISAKQDRS